MEEIQNKIDKMNEVELIKFRENIEVSSGSFSERAAIIDIINTKLYKNYTNVLVESSEPDTSDFN